MRRRHLHPAAAIVAAALLLGGCADDEPVEGAGMDAFTGVRLIDGTGASPLERAVIIVQNGVVQAVGEEGVIEIPAGARRVDLEGLTMVPGLINTHGHVGDVRGLQTGQYSRENVLEQLGVYARYGVTTVVSLGDDQEAGVQIRDEQRMDPALNRARLVVAGPVLDPTTPVEAEEQVADLATMNVDWAKIRIDSNLGTTPKMSEETYTAVIRNAHAQGLPVAVHVVELEDAKGAVQAGADFVGHSVRDLPVDDELIALLRERRICVSPTLTRELSTFVYGERPDFFDDPFFLAEADPGVIQQLQDPERQERTRQSEGAQYWRQQLPLAMENLFDLSEAGVRIAMGTDSGPPGRFQGYFEHLEMEMMAEAGMTPMQILVSATGNAARCVGLDAELGTIEPGRRADFVLLRANPLDDIRNTRSIESVWIQGNRVPDA